MKNYRETIRDLREDRDLKQADVATALGTTQQYYSRYETGEHELSIRALAVLADFYGVSADFILGRTQCAQGIDALNTQVTPDRTAGEILSQILALDESGRSFVLDALARSVKI